MRNIHGRRLVCNSTRLTRQFSNSFKPSKDIQDARRETKDPRLGRLIKDDFAAFRDSYGNEIKSQWDAS